MSITRTAEVFVGCVIPGDLLQRQLERLLDEKDREQVEELVNELTTTTDGFSETRQPVYVGTSLAAINLDDSLEPIDITQLITAWPAHQCRPFLNRLTFEVNYIWPGSRPEPVTDFLEWFTQLISHSEWAYYLLATIS